MRFTLAIVVLAAVTLSAQSTPMLPAETLLDRGVLKAFDEELSGVAAKDHVGRLTQMHRVPASHSLDLGIADPERIDGSQVGQVDDLTIHPSFWRNAVPLAIVGN